MTLTPEQITEMLEIAYGSLNVNVVNNVIKVEWDWDRAIPWLQNYLKILEETKDG